MNIASLVDMTNKPRDTTRLTTTKAASISSTESSSPAVRVIHGFKVTAADEEYKVFIIDLVSPETCGLIRRLADEHCAQAEASGNSAASWRCLYTYTKMDLPCCEVKELVGIINTIMAKVIKIVGEIFEDPEGASKLRPRSWKEPHLLKYQAVDGFPRHTGICEHYDGKSIAGEYRILLRVSPRSHIHAKQYRTQLMCFNFSRLLILRQDAT